jgi:2-succinyl-5-enolpyruvyl-6-hydroxy-3-cyclohexene-1-carboxylate synthase
MAAVKNEAEGNLIAAVRLLSSLQALGLRRLVLCPGSRSGPLAIAAGIMEQRGLTLHTGIDERSAAFFTLGLSRADGRPAAVITTSGTAVANLLPAAVEADQGAIPLLLLTADRPARLKNCGANQTVNQEAFLRPCCRWFGSGDPGGIAAMAEAALTSLAQQAWEAAAGTPAGPVHLNLPFEEPLHPDAAMIGLVAAGAGPAPAEVHARPEAGSTPEPAALATLDPERPGVVVAGPWRGHPAAWQAFRDGLRGWQARSGWPVLADGLSGLRGEAGLAMATGYDVILERPTAELEAAQLLRLGPTPASRRLQRWIAAQRGPQLLITEADPRDLDPFGTASARFGGGLKAWFDALPGAVRQGRPQPDSLALQRRWLAAEALCQQRLDQLLPASGLPNEPALARVLSRQLAPGLPLMLASSSPVRDWESFADPDGPARPVFGFRGASGIDGTLSMAAGLAESLGRLLLLTGDLALLHDANGWLWHHQLHGQLTVVLIDNGGGGIFEQLPIRPAAPVADSAAGLDFERLFAMPQSLDHATLAAAHGVPARRVTHLEHLGEALAWSDSLPVSLLVLVTDRGADAALRRRLRGEGESRRCRE